MEVPGELEVVVLDLEVLAAAAATFAALTSDDIDTPIGAVLPLAEAAEAHRRLEGRETTAPIVLKP